MRADRLVLAAALLGVAAAAHITNGGALTISWAVPALCHASVFMPVWTPDC